VRLSNDGTRAVAWGDARGSSEVTVYDTDSARVMARNVLTREVSGCYLSEADNFIYVAGGATLRILETRAGGEVRTGKTLIVLRCPNLRVNDFRHLP
jgi:DNA-binding beta-propeller fold protein YncE